MNEELRRIKAEYERRDAANLSEVYTYTNPAFLFHMQERERAILGALHQAAIRLPECRVLEVGCGTGHILQRFLEFGAREAVGVDLMLGRIQTGKTQYPCVALSQGNAAQLPFRDGQFDLVAQFMCLSSVLDGAMRREIAGEMWRVLKPGGTILSYDLRPIAGGSLLFWRLVGVIKAILRRIGLGAEADPQSVSSEPPTPIQPLAPADIMSLFPGQPVRQWTASLDFQLAGTARVSPLLAGVLSSFPFLRTHCLVLARKPE